MKFLTQNFHLPENISTRMIEFLDDLPDSLPGDDEVQSSIAQMVDEALAEKIRIKRAEIVERKAAQRRKLLQATKLIKTTKLFEKKAAAEKRLRQREARMDLRKYVLRAVSGSTSTIKTHLSLSHFSLHSTGSEA